MSTQISPASKLVATLSIPALVDRPFIGSGCCVIAADEAIKQELESWPAALSATVSANTGEAVILLAEPNADLDPVIEALESLGYPTSIKSNNHSERR